MSSLPLTLFLTLVLPGSLAPVGSMGVDGTVTDGAQPLSDTFVGIVRGLDVDALTEDWMRVPLFKGAVTNATGAYSIGLSELALGERYWVFTGSLTRFNQYWSDGVGGAEGLPALPTKGDLELYAPVPLRNTQEHLGIDFELRHPSVFRDIPVPVGGSGVTLLTDVYAATPGTLPTEGVLGDPVILVRTPYDKAGPDPGDPSGGGLISTYTSWTLMGYTVVLQNTRGRNGSTGTNDVFRSDAWTDPEERDGADTVNWIAAQPWCDGAVGIVGPSALAITGYLAAGASPDALRAAYAWAGTSDLYSLYFHGGVYREEAMERWLSDQLGGENARDAYLNAPNKIVANPHRSPFWDAVDTPARASEVRVPMLHLVGWFDLFGQEGIRSFRTLDLLGATAGAGLPGAFDNQRILIGPWSHIDWFNATQGDLVYPGSAGPGNAQSPQGPSFSESLTFKSELRFFDHWLRLEPRGIANGYDAEPPVRYYTLGNTDPGGAGNEWHEASAWPPPELDVESTRLYLTRKGGLRFQRRTPAARPLGGSAARLAYDYDPLDPAPTIGGPILYATGAEPAGPRDQRPVEARPDVLTFSSPALIAPVEVTGEVRCHLVVSSDAVDTDFVVKLTDVYPDGRSILLTEGVLQARYRNGFDTSADLLSGDESDVYRLDVSLGEISFLLDTGHRLRIAVTSSNAPRLKPNPNTGATFFTADLTPGNTRVARNSIWCRPFGGGRGSYVELPFVLP